MIMSRWIAGLALVAIITMIGALIGAVLTTTISDSPAVVVVPIDSNSR